LFFGAVDASMNAFDSLRILIHYAYTTNVFLY
jgi:hypothetical protein